MNKPTFGGVFSKEGKLKNPAKIYIDSLSSDASKTTMRSYLKSAALMMGVTDIEEADWCRLRKHHIIDMTASLAREGKSAASINTFLAAIKGVCRECWDLGEMPLEEYMRIQSIKSKRVSPKLKGRELKPHEVIALIESLWKDGTAKGSRDAAIFAVAIGCGLRRKEISLIRTEEVDWEEGSILIHGKGNKERTVYMPPETREILHEWVSEHRGWHPGPLFLRILKGDKIIQEPLTAHAVNEIVRHHVLRLGLEKFTPHDMRRTFASWMLRDGHDLNTVKEALGHSNVATTQKYDLRDLERLKQVSKTFTILRD
ncbi:integrase [Candidatus Parcubacteria bacterium]|nr:MAG: integrase [Candidatus Parcubacteria bacterium]